MVCLSDSSVSLAVATKKKKKTHTHTKENNWKEEKQINLQSQKKIYETNSCFHVK